ncbi:cytosol aminopeptidase-like [Daktulosphaira vitifoliae]|uniref:cytosol aminopeptidase-like n=1 Tax=Daktulosphaira vitifoliae TaxID=58002 RepID=UPI0021AAB4E4|nr:cytosol aminopeptidase-like [Daktulosphaira vitifoliae]
MFLTKTKFSSVAKFYKLLSGVCQRSYAELVPCSPTGVSPSLRGLVLGCYAQKGDLTGETLSLTAAASNFNNSVEGKLMEQLKMAKPPPARGDVRTFFGLNQIFPYVSVVGLDDGCLGYNETEGIDEKKECIRNAAALGVQSLQNFDVQKIFLEDFTSAESSAEGASMGMWAYQDLKSRSTWKNMPKIELHDSCDWTGWQIGLQKGSAQNLTRQLQEIPANLLSPKIFARNAVTILSNQGIDLVVRGKNYIQSRNMNGLLAVASGSCEEPQLLEATYEGCDLDVPPIVMIAPGMTYNSGGLGSLRYCDDQKQARGEVSGAAALMAVLRAVSALKMNLNLKVLIPLAENVIGGGAMEPGSVITTKSKKTVAVVDTVKASQLMVADVMTMVAESKGCYIPKLVIDIGPYVDANEIWSTLALGVFTQDDSLMETMKAAAIHTGDRVWRLPLWEQARVQMRSPYHADLINSGPVYGGHAMHAAAFLEEFVPSNAPWLHLDNSGLLRTTGQDAAYLAPGMSGRPTRTIIELLGQMTCDSNSDKKKT